MKYLVKPNFAIFFIFGFSMQTAIAQTQITHQIISNGGATMSNGSYRLTGTVGQPAIGSGSSADHTLSGGFWAQAGVVVTSVEEIEQNTLPETFRLEQNYPNPFNPTTVISYQLSKASNIELTIYNQLGQEVRTLVSGRQSAATHHVQWDGRDNVGKQVVSGVYLYRLRADEFVQARKMVVLR